MATYPTYGVPSEQPVTQHSSWGVSPGLRRYQVRMAENESDRVAAYRLRFLVFNLEMNEGLEAAYQRGEDRDEYDFFCDHLVVEDKETGSMIGTYRLQSGFTAKQNLGFYSEREFNFAPYENLRDSLLELGRACVHPDHRTMEVLTLLWRGIAHYARERKLRYLIGCSSLPTQDTQLGSDVYRYLENSLTSENLQTIPTSQYSFPLEKLSAKNPKIPKLLRGYLTVGAKICGPPAFDRGFKTIDFLTFLDLEALSPIVRARFLR